MKRSLEELSFTVSCTSLSQADVPGAEQACTAIAVVSCAHFLLERAPMDMELCIRQGGALYQSFGVSRHVHAKEMIDFCSPAWPISAGEEEGMLLENLNDYESLFVTHQAVVLTCGAFSMAILASGTILWDSHANQDEDNKAVSIQFGSASDLIAYIKEKFVDPKMECSLCVVRRRLFHGPTTYAQKEPALAHARRLPPGFFHVWARDVNTAGAKQFLVAGLEDFVHYYSNLDPRLRCHYDLALTDRPISFYMDLEFETFEENRGDPREMLDTLLKLVQEVAGVQMKFRIYDSSKDGRQPMSVEEEEELVDSEASSSTSSKDEEEEDEEDEPSVSVSLVDEEEQVEDDEEEEEPFELGKVSFHVHSRSLFFSSRTEHAAFMKRVEAQASGIKILWVWRLKKNEMRKEFFADQTVYDRDRNFRLPYSSKLGKNRPFLPLDSAEENVTWEHVFGALISPPTVELYLDLPPRVEAVAVEEEEAQVQDGDGDGLHPISSAPDPIRVLASAVEAEFKPQRMRGFQLTPTGLVTFSMVKHDCPICKDTHNNQVYAMCDLKQRVMYAKCHADRTKVGVDIPFPESCGSLSLINSGEMQPGERASLGIYPADSSTARVILGFARAIYSSARTAPKVPSNVTVHYDKLAEQYDVPIPEVCVHDGGTHVLQLTKTKMTIRCTGKRCASQGKRWDRPSHSASSKPVWKLEFLFPPTSGAVVVATASSAGGGAVLGPEAFLQEQNLFKALGFSPTVGAPQYLYDDRLKQLEEWAALQQKEAGAEVDPIAQQVRRKAAIARRILMDDLMEACYRECLAVSDDFVYPVQLIPRGPSTIASALWIHLARQHGYKRVEDMFYVPTTDRSGRSFYRAVPMDDLLTSVCTFELTPNLCHSVMWNGRVCDDLRRLLQDRNHFPSLPISKRYLGFANAVYDLEANVALTWEEVRADPSIMPFNFLDRPFPVEMLEHAKEHCPNVSVVDRQVVFDGPLDFVPTPLFDGPLHDQQFPVAVIFWLYACLGRMFHYVDRDGDNWEILPFLMGAPGSFKSSIISILMKFLQEWQVGVIGTRVEGQFPLDGILGTLMAFMPEAGGCTIDRDLLKQVITGDAVNIAGKYKRAINVPSWRIPFLFAGNSFLKVLDLDGSLERRIALFPFLFMLRDGEGATDLAQRIFKEEAALLLIKWNTIYWKIRQNVRGKIQSMLPPTIREATRQAIMQSDSFKGFFAQQVILEEESSVSWSDLWDAYLAWCKQTGKTHYSVDPYLVETQAMLRRYGCSFENDHVQNARLRLPTDPAFQSAFQVRMVRRLLGCICGTPECARNCRTTHEMPPANCECHVLRIQPNSSALETVIEFEEQLADDDSEWEILALEAWSDAEIHIWLQ